MKTKDQQEIIIDWNSEQSIATAERKKSRLENKGYTYIDTVRTGINKQKMIYRLE